MPRNAVLLMIDVEGEIRRLRLRGAETTVRQARPIGQEVAA